MFIIGLLITIFIILNPNRSYTLLFNVAKNKLLHRIKNFNSILLIN